MFLHVAAAVLARDALSLSRPPRKPQVRWDEQGGGFIPAEVQLIHDATSLAVRNPAREGATEQDGVPLSLFAVGYAASQFAPHVGLCQMMILNFQWANVY